MTKNNPSILRCGKNKKTEQKDHRWLPNRNQACFAKMSGCGLQEGRRVR